MAPLSATGRSRRNLISHFVAFNDFVVRARGPPRFRDAQQRVAGFGVPRVRTNLLRVCLQVCLQNVAQIEKVRVSV